MILRRSFVVVSSLFALAGTAEARMLHSPLVFPDGNTQLLCSVINADDDREIVVKIEAVGFDGEVIESSQPVTLEPGQVGGINVSAGEGAQYCRFDLVSGSRRAARASACLFEHGVGCVSSADAS